MWPFSNAKEKMLKRELEEHRQYREAQQASALVLEERLNDNRNALVAMTVKRDLLAMQARRQQEEISRLNTVLANVPIRSPKTGRYVKAWVEAKTPASEDLAGVP